MQYPEITFEILKEIIKDGLALTCPIKRVGIVGSYARGDAKKTSDVDLLIDTDDAQFNEMLNTFGEFVSHTLDYQFNKKLDIVRYSLAIKRAAAPPETERVWYYQEGYQQMLQEVIWLYEG